MLSYRHAFHAGNFADVAKHVVIAEILSYLIKKDRPVRYIDTHAGAGCYDLTDVTANKLAEYQQGIVRLWDQTDLPESLSNYIALVKSHNPAANLTRYPGSPLIAQTLLRSHDQLDLCEMHPRDFASLQQLFADTKRVRCHFEDGFSKSVALVPPLEKRALVVIDPSYEIKTDYKRVVELIKQLYKRFATGVYALWYPIVDKTKIDKLERDVIASGIRRVDLYEISHTGDLSKSGMTGCGIIVINPTWQLRARIEQAFDYYARLISDTGVPYYRIKELASE